MCINIKKVTSSNGVKLQSDYVYIYIHEHCMYRRLLVVIVCRVHKRMN